MLAAWGIMAGLTLLALSLGLQASLLGVRAGIEGFSTEVTGLTNSAKDVMRGQLFNVEIEKAELSTFTEDHLFGRFRLLVGPQHLAGRRVET